MSTLYRLRTTFVGVQGAPWLNTLWFDAGSGTAQQAANAAGAFWGAVDNRMATTVTWSTEADVFGIDTATGHPVTVDHTTPVTGTGSGSASELPIETQGLVQLRTGVFLGSREVRGRFFIPALTENDNDNGMPNASILAVVNPAATTLISGTGYQLQVYSRAQTQAEDVFSASMWTQWAGLKSRRD